VIKRIELASDKKVANTTTTKTRGEKHTYVPGG